MEKLFIISILFCTHIQAFASGCDSRYFQRGVIQEQTIIRDYGRLEQEKAKELLAQLTRDHKKALHTWSQPPAIKPLSELKIVATTYKNLDTDCGWTHYGSELTIIQLAVTSVSERESFVYPDIYKDIDPESSGIKDYLKNTEVL